MEEFLRYCQAPGPGPGPGLVLTWSYPGQDRFLVKTGPGVDTIIKQTTPPTTPPPHTNFFNALYALPRQVLMKPGSGVDTIRDPI